MQKLRGTGVALVTPFHTDGTVDVEGLQRVVTHSIAGGIDYLVVLGTTAESVTLTKAEKKLVVDTVVATNNGKIPLVLGIGGNNTVNVMEEIKQTNLSAFDAILSVSPSYNKPTQEGIYQHFKQIATSTSKPILLYNVPGRTASNMLPETVSRLAHEFDNIIGVKEAAGDLAQAMRLIQHKPKDFLVISGDDMIALPMVLAGGDGVISVIGQGIPKAFSDMIRFGLDYKVSEANALHYKVMDSIDYIFEEGNPAGIKAVFEKLEICNATVRLPLVEATPQLKKKISDFIDSF